LNNILIIINNFNIRDNDWDPLYPHYSIHVNALKEIADSSTLKLSTSVDWISICYINNSQNLNLVLDLIFLYTNVEKFNNYIILSNL